LLIATRRYSSPLITTHNYSSPFTTLYFVHRFVNNNMKQLLLVRHGKAEDHSAVSQDFDRRLVERGRTDVSGLAALVNAVPFAPSFIVSSAAPRAKETAEILAQEVLSLPTLVLQPSLYLASAPALLHVIEQLSDDHDAVIIVAHNPGIRDAAAILCSEFLPSFPTAGAVLVSFECELWAGCEYVGAGSVRHFFPER
jgi:phosphohistidine phosphatase